MTVYNCLVVDDEDLILERLKYFFAERSGIQPFRLIGEAFSGEEGLAFAASKVPDIVISDIVMPVMDGLTMIERMRELYPNMIFIVLSAYSDFAYAKRAISSGVIDYVVKVPLNESDLERALTKAAYWLDQNKNNQNRLQELNMSLLENKYRIRKQLFSEFFRGGGKAIFAESIISRLGLQFDADRYCAIAITINQYQAFCQTYAFGDQSAIKYGMMNVIEEVIGLHGNGFVLEMEDQLFLAYLSWPTTRSMHEYERISYGLCSDIAINIKEYLKWPVSLTVSSIYHDTFNMMTAALQAKEIACDLFYLDGTVVTPTTRIVYRNEDLSHLAALIVDLLVEIKGRPAIAAINQLLHQHKVPPKALASLMKHIEDGISNRMRIRLSLEAVQQVMKAVTVQEWSAGLINGFRESIAAQEENLLRPEVQKPKRILRCISTSA